MLRDSGEIFTDETERKPNLYAANVLAGVVAVILIVCAINEFGVFEVNKTLMRSALLVAVLMFALVQLAVRKPIWLTLPSIKYVIMGMVLFLVFTITVFLNIHAVLAFVLPLLLATQYRSKRVSALALIGSCVCCLAAPVLSYFLDTWSLVFLTGYIQTFCRVTVEVTPGNNIGTMSAVWQILLYWAMPQTLTVMSFGVILYSVTKHGIESVKNQVHIVDLSNDLNKQLESISSMQERVLFLMSDIIESRDLETGGHVRRTSEIVRLLMNEMRDDPESGVTDDFCNNVIKTAPMHDLGKIAIPDTILRKAERLTSEEFETVKLHPVKSAEIIDSALTGLENEALITVARNIARHHHEKIDGSGYPDGLSGKQIPLEARIMAIADVYDALVSERYYKASFAPEEAFEMIESMMGTQLDPDLNRYFIKCRRNIEKFYEN